MADSKLTPPGSGLAAALAKFQSEVPTPKKTKTATVPTKSGGQFTYSYADLADLTAVVLPLLGKHGLSFTSMPTEREDGAYGLVYQLMHESGEMLDGFYRLDPHLSAQGKGGEITYARRYCLSAITGVAAEEDTDAQGVEAETQQRQQARASRPQSRRPVADDSGPYGPSIVTDSEGGIVLAGPEHRGQTVSPEHQMLADLAFTMLDTGKTKEELQTSVYDVARASRGWLGSPVVHPVSKEIVPLSEAIRSAKTEMEKRDALAAS